MTSKAGCKISISSSLNGNPTPHPSSARVTVIAQSIFDALLDLHSPCHKMFVDSLAPLNTTTSKAKTAFLIFDVINDPKMEYVLEFVPMIGADWGLTRMSGKKSKVKLSKIELNDSFLMIDTPCPPPSASPSSQTGTNLGNLSARECHLACQIFFFFTLCHELLHSLQDKIFGVDSPPHKQSAARLAKGEAAHMGYLGEEKMGGELIGMWRRGRLAEWNSLCGLGLKRLESGTEEILLIDTSLYSTIVSSLPNLSLNFMLQASTVTFVDNGRYSRSRISDGLTIIPEGGGHFGRSGSLESEEEVGMVRGDYPSEEDNGSENELDEVSIGVAKIGLGREQVEMSGTSLGTCKRY